MEQMKKSKERIKERKEGQERKGKKEETRKKLRKKENKEKTKKRYETVYSSGEESMGNDFHVAKMSGFSISFSSKN